MTDTNPDLQAAMDRLKAPPTETEISEAIAAIRRECTGHEGVVDVIRRLAFQRDITPSPVPNGTECDHGGSIGWKIIDDTAPDGSLLIESPCGNRKRIWCLGQAERHAALREIGKEPTAANVDPQPDLTAMCRQLLEASGKGVAWEVMEIDLTAMSAKLGEFIQAERVVLDNGQSSWDFACDWYKPESIQHSLAYMKDRAPFEPYIRQRLPPKDHDSLAFAEWLANEYRLSMNKGIEIGTRSMRELTADRDRLKEENDKEQSRWQTAIYDLLKSLAPRPHQIDGGGCDSGDPLDVTLSEITQAFNQIDDDAFDQQPSHDHTAICRQLIETYLAIPCSTNGSERLAIMAGRLGELLGEPGKRLKGLAWEQGGESYHLYAQTPFGFYHIDTHKMIWWLSGVFGHGTQPAKIDTVDSGKVDVELDYSRRVDELYEVYEVQK